MRASCWILGMEWSAGQTVSALLALTFQGMVCVCVWGGWREKEGGGFTLRDGEQDRGEGRAIGMEGVNEREGEGCRVRKI